MVCTVIIAFNGIVFLQPISADFYPRRGMYYAAPFEGELYRARIESVEREQDPRSNQWIDVVEVDWFFY